MSFLDKVAGTSAGIREKGDHLSDKQEDQIARMLLKSEKAFNARKRAKWAKAASLICEKINNTLEIGIAYVNNEIEKKKGKSEEYEKRGNVAKNYSDTNDEVKAKLLKYHTAFNQKEFEQVDNKDTTKLASQSDYELKQGLLIAKLALGSISTLADIFSEVCEAAAHQHGPNPGEADFTYNFLARTSNINYDDIVKAASTQSTKHFNL